MFTLLCWTIFVSFEATKLPCEFSGKKNSTWPCFRVIFPESDVGISTFHKHSITPNFRNWLFMLLPPRTPFRSLRETPTHSEKHTATSRRTQPLRHQQQITNSEPWMPFQQRLVCLWILRREKADYQKAALSELSSPALGIVKCAVNGARLGAWDLANARIGWL